MKQLLIISGKGGTGKTILTASFAVLAESKVMADCDVDAADLHLLLNPKIRENHEFKSGLTAVINKEICTNCGRCRQLCRFKAIDEDINIDEVSCEGCALCSYACPVGAIRMREDISGRWFISDTDYGPMVHAKLGVAAENSGKLVTLVRDEAKKIAERDNKKYIIIDGPPGIGCPVIASLANIDLTLIVTEPTLSGISDLKRVALLSKKFKVSTKVIINKYDINLKNTQEIKNICRRMDIDILGQLPFSQEVPKSLTLARPLVAVSDSKLAAEIKSLWERVEEEL